MIRNLFSLFLLILLAACSLPQNALPTQTPPPPTETATALPTNTPKPTVTQTFTPTATSTFTPTLTPSPSPTPIPTYTTLRGKVLERANCRYGPGAPYLYKYGLVAESNLEIIGRLDDANWIQIQAIGGDNPCWVKASLMEVTGDIFSVEPVYPDKASLPVSPYYEPLTLRSITREIDQVTITWYGQTLRAGDEEFTNAPFYVAEIWACEGGVFKFTPYALWQEDITVTNEKGCEERSHGRIYFSEKHGYAGPTEFEFPE
jgi:hypothetical protein